MKQYILKDALVAEIKRRLWLLVPKMTFHQQRVELEKLLSFIDTIEVKEVVAEQEGICNGIFNRIVGNNCNLLIPLDKVGLKHGDKVKIFITKEK